MDIILKSVSLFCPTALKTLESSTVVFSVYADNRGKIYWNLASSDCVYDIQGGNSFENIVLRFQHIFVSTAAVLRNLWTCSKQLSFYQRNNLFS